MSSQASLHPVIFRLSICSASHPSSFFFSYRVLTSKYSERGSSSFSIVHLMTQNFPKLTTMTEVRKNSIEATTFSKLSARKMSKVGVSAKAGTPKRRFCSQKICDAEIEVSAEAEVEVPLLRKLQNLSQCDRALFRPPARCTKHFGQHGGACHYMYSATVLAPPTLAPTLQRLPALAPVTLARPEARHGVLAPARSSFQRQDLKKKYKRTQFSIGKTMDGDYHWIKTTISLLQ